MRKFPIGVQPYTVREEMKKDYVGTLEKIAALGYKGVEMGRPPEGMSIAEQKQLLNRLGLHVISSGAGFNNIDFDPQEVMDYLEEVDGGKFITISLKFDSKEDLLEKAKKSNAIGEQLSKRGFIFLYHNHDWEFEKYDGEYGMDIFLQETSPEYVQMELDTYWTERAGIDTADYLRTRLNNRCPLLHIKDMEAGEEKFFAEIGEGVLNFTEIAAAADEVGVQWMVVEQDQSRRSPLESLSISYNNLVNLGFMQ